VERETREREADQLEMEIEKSSNLQSVLEDFQSVKELELKQVVVDFEARLGETTDLLAQFKSRALTAEVALEEARTNADRSSELGKELKEKNLLIGKLRHETVILNEHLTEALRRLRKNSTETNVDRRLVTNVLLSFITTPRTDGKRFEMLSLLASILSWSDSERERAGLQRTTTPSSFWGSSSKGKNPELEKSDETESFSKMWVEFLLKEAAQGASTSAVPSPLHSNNSLPNSPRRTSSSLGGPTKSPPIVTKRLPSFASSAMASSPNLSMVTSLRKDSIDVDDRSAEAPS